MIDRLMSEIEAAKAVIADWQRKEQEAHEQVLLGRGYLQALVRALELAQPGETTAEASKLNLDTWKVWLSGRAK